MVPTWAENRSNMAEICYLSRYLIYVQILKRCLCQVGPNMGPSWVAKSQQKSLKLQFGRQKAAKRTPEASGSPFWTLRGTILDPPGVDLGPPRGWFSLQCSILFHAYRLYRLSTYLASCRYCYPDSLGRRVPALALTVHLFSSQLVWRMSGRLRIRRALWLEACVTLFF